MVGFSNWLGLDDYQMKVLTNQVAMCPMKNAVLKWEHSQKVLCDFLIAIWLLLEEPTMAYLKDKCQNIHKFPFCQTL